MSNIPHATEPVLAKRPHRVGRGQAPATCGELVQGVAHGHDFLVTLPVYLKVRARAVHLPNTGLTVKPASKHKAYEAGVELLRHLDRAPASVGIEVAIDSPVPEGKGTASSSADIVATCRAIADLLGVQVDDTEIAAIACRVEPTDGVMYDRPVAFDFLRGRLLDDPATTVRLLALAVDVGGVVDTVGFRRVPYTQSERRELQDAYDSVIGGLRADDTHGIGRAATSSARINQRRHFKPHFDDLVGIAEAFGGCGVNVAHSGTIAAVLFEGHATEAAGRASRAIGSRFPAAHLRVLRAGEQHASTP